MTAARFRFEDNGLGAALSNIELLGQLRLFVGYQPPDGGEMHPGSGVTIALMAAIHEWGSPEQGIPSRSFIRRTVLQRESEIADLQRKAVEDVMHGRVTPVDAISNVGRSVCGMIRDTLQSASGWAEPLDPETVEAKGHARPLDETQALAEKLSWAVKRGRQIVARGN
jgi:hypothetical protein